LQQTPHFHPALVQDLRKEHNMTVKTRTVLSADISTLFADNMAGDISEADLRAVTTDLADSQFNLSDDDSDAITQGSTNLFMTTAEQTKLSKAVQSDNSGVAGADAITNIVSLTQGEYDAIGAPDSTTLYYITDAS
jgi:hypothetical protein